MNDVVSMLGRMTDFLFALTCVGAPFLLWKRSKTAALIGAGAGAIYLFMSLVSFGMSELMAHNRPTMALRIVQVLVSAVRNLGFYGGLLAVIGVLGRAPATVQR